MLTISVMLCPPLVTLRLISPFLLACGHVEPGVPYTASNSNKKQNISIDKKKLSQKTKAFIGAVSAENG